MLQAIMKELTHGLSGLLWSFGFTIVPMWVALVRGRARLRNWPGSFLVALPLTIIGLILAALVDALLHHIGLIGDILTEILRIAVLMLLGYEGGKVMSVEGRPKVAYRRGAVVSSTESSLRRQRWHHSKGDQDGPIHLTPVMLAGMPIAIEDETKHFKFIGTTGTGKSTAIRELLSSALARGDRAIVADPDGGYLSHFYNADRGDVILNPFEPDSLKWHLLGEITTAYDVDQLARSLIPDSAGSDRIWSGYARTFFTAVIHQIIAGRIQDDGEIFRLVTMASRDELRLLLAGTMAGPFLEEGNEKMFGSVRSVTTSAIDALRYTAQQRAAPLSVRQWVREGAAVKNGGKGGVLFLPYKAGEIAALRSSISAWMRIAIFEAMNRADGDQRLWFVVDELDALGEIDGLKDALARLRKFGGRCVLGFQSISQVSSTYGKGAADTIVENCGNTLILRCSASEQGGTSQFASRLIGQREVVHTSTSKTQHSQQWGTATTTNEQRSIEPAVMASEIERLPDLAGFLKFASVPDWMRVRLSYVGYPTVIRPARPEAVKLPDLPALNT